MPEMVILLLLLPLTVLLGEKKRVVVASTSTHTSTTLLNRQNRRRGETVAEYFRQCCEKFDFVILKNMFFFRNFDRLELLSLAYNLTN